MALIRALGTGVSGLKNFQTDLDVVGNNLANVSTTGYKQERITFQDAMNQTLRAAQPSINATQVGLGSKVGAIDADQTSGTLTSTGQPLDLAIKGAGFFVLDTSEQHATQESTLFTRDGHFHLDGDGYLVTDAGLRVQGRKRDPTTGAILPPDTEKHMVYTEAIQIPKAADSQGASSKPNLDVSSVSVSGDGMIHYKLSGSSAAYEVGPVAIDQIYNPEGLERLGNNVLRDNDASGKEHYDDNTDKKIVSGTLEASNVDMTEQMTTLIEAQRAYQANAETITTADQILDDLVKLKRS
ncbi:MAG: flagellar hook-basal body complex protein [Sporolactobacillus sp.]